MAIKAVVQRNQQSIVPIRFYRAVANDPPDQNSDPVRDAPAVDDRGFEMGTRQATWGSSDAHGAMVAIQKGDTIKIKILRTDIDDDADLYVTSTNTSVITIASPNNGGPIPKNGANKNIFQITGVKDKRNTPVKVEVRYNSTTGPVIGELEPHIFQPVNLSTAFHIVSIRGTSPAKTAADAQTMLDYANDIWRPCGIQFTFNSAQHFYNETIRQHPTNVNRSQYRNRATGTWSNLPYNFDRAGYVTDDERWTPAQGGSWRESDMIERVNPANVSINFYWSHNSASYNKAGIRTDGSWNGLSGVGMHRKDGLHLVESAGKYDLGHEIGHFLSLNHSDDDNAGKETDNKDIWLLRRLMYSLWPPDSPDYKKNVGYGDKQYGALVSVKKMPGKYQNNDGELTRSRKHARKIN